MPSKEEIFAKLLYLINAPAQRLVTAMGAVGRNLAVVVDQGVKENKFQGVRAGTSAARKFKI
jgi:large subunit ribosomal protein L10